MFEMKVKAVTVSPTGDFLVLLVDKDEKKVLPIMIGALEANNIVLPLQGVKPPRPMTHDLLKSVIEHLGGKLDKIIITDIRDNTYYAEIYITLNGEIIVLDSRPSDAIALALRCNAPIYMAPGLVEFTYDMSDMKFEDNDI
ncbi:bifunctional nuclease family protein [Thermoanaerobacterium sp. DL9XJH110]|uniref:bifunctional nuclease family protein n=1 Tax=Thermoanaerobacterium sp. DL9XJH110 TaxID=3386643 RepID=UPI003BB55CE2